MEKTLFEKKIVSGKNMLSDNLRITQNSQLFSESNIKRITFKRKKKCESIQQQKDLLISENNDNLDKISRGKDKSSKEIQSILQKFKRENNLSFQFWSKDHESTNNKNVSTPSNIYYKKSSLKKVDNVIHSNDYDKSNRFSTEAFKSVLKNLNYNKCSFNIKSLDPLKYFSEKNSKTDEKKKLRKLYITNITDNVESKVFNTFDHETNKSLELKEKIINNNNTLDSNTLSTKKKNKYKVDSIDNTDLTNHNWKKKCYNLPYRKELECENLFVLDNLNKNHRFHSRVESMRINMKSEEHYRKIKEYSKILPQISTKKKR